MSDFADQMWSNAGRDLEGEQVALARTAALHEAETVVWPLLANAVTEVEMGHRLALVHDQLQAVADRRGYDRVELEADLVRRWKILAEARTAAAPAAQEEDEEEDWDPVRAMAVARMAATAAAENPGLTIRACLELAEAAADLHLTVEAAYPLAYENWGHVVNGPLMDRIKSWRPNGVPWGRGRGQGAPASPSAPSGGAGAYDEVKSRLDALEQKIPSTPSRPSEAAPGSVPKHDFSDLYESMDRAVDHHTRPYDSEARDNLSNVMMDVRMNREHDRIEQVRRDHGLTHEQENDDHAADMERRLDRLQQGMGGGSPTPAAPAAHPAPAASSPTPAAPAAHPAPAASSPTPAAPAAHPRTPHRNAPHPGQAPLPGMEQNSAPPQHSPDADISPVLRLDHYLRNRGRSESS